MRTVAYSSRPRPTHSEVIENTREQSTFMPSKSADLRALGVRLPSRHHNYLHLFECSLRNRKVPNPSRGRSSGPVAAMSARHRVALARAHEERVFSGFQVF